jgi:hypothetical protein
MAADADGQQPSTSSAQPPRKQPKVYKKLDAVTPEQLAQEELMNNCFVKTVISGIMGSGLGLVFGVFMGAMDSAVGCCSSCRCTPMHKKKQLMACSTVSRNAFEDHQAYSLPSMARHQTGRLVSVNLHAPSQGSGMDMSGAPKVENQTTRQVLKQMLKTTGQRSM